MAWLTRLRNTFFQRDSARRAIDDEIAFHLEERTRTNIERGMAPDEARHEAQLRFGARARLTEEIRDADTLQWLESLLRDSRFALRGLRRRPGVALTAILSLSLGVGATSAIFSVVDTVLLKPLPYPEPDRLIEIQESLLQQRVGGNPARRLDWHQQLTALLGVAGIYSEGVVLTGKGEPRRLVMRRSLGPVFAILGVAPQYGRAFGEWEQQAVVLSHQAWQTHFGGQLSILGSRITLSQTPYTVVGIMPRVPGDGQPVDLFAPANSSFNSPDRSGNWLDLVARLKPGETLESLNTQLATVAARLRAEYPATDKGLTAFAQPMLTSVTGEARRPLWLLLSAIGTVLLVICANIVSLLLVRANERQREFAIRAALGSGRGKLLRLQLLESALLGLIGGTGGILVAYWGVELLRYALPAGLPRAEAIHLDSRTAAFSFILALTAGLLCGLLAAIGGISSHLLQSGLRTTRRTWLRPAFVVLQVVLSTLLLSGAARFTESLIVSLRTPLGFQPDQLIALSYSFPWDTNKRKLDTTYQASLERLATIPGVTSVGFTDQLPLRGGTQSGQIEIPGRDLVPALKNLPVSHRGMSDGYFATLGLPMKAGRVFRPRANEVMECVVNATFAQLFFPGTNPIGQRLTFDTKRQPGKEAHWMTITGVVTDLRQEPNQLRPAAEVFTPFQSVYWPLANFVLRTSGDPARIMAAAREQMHAVDPYLPIESLRPLSQELSEATKDDRAITSLLGAFALIALLVAGIGLYGLLAGEVTALTHEIGIRLALGAEPHTILCKVVRRGLLLVATGLILGLALTYPAHHLIASQLSGLSPSALPSHLMAATIMLVAALAASVIPAQRASRVAPAIALRHE